MMLVLRGTCPTAKGVMLALSLLCNHTWLVVAAWRCWGWQEPRSSTLNPSGMCPQALSSSSQEPHHPTGFISNEVTLYLWLLVLSSQLVLNLDGEAIWVIFWPLRFSSLGFPGGSDGKESAAMQETQVQSLGQEDLQEKGMATYSSILAWRIPWTEAHGGLQSMGSQRVRHVWATNNTNILDFHPCCLCSWWKQLLLSRFSRVWLCATP